VSQTFQTNTYTYLYACAKWVKEQPIPEEFPGYDTYRQISHMTFLAFTLEAFLNHCGSLAIPWWDKAERTLSTEAKLNIVMDLAKVDFKYEERPMQSLTTLLRFRNEIAHGKTVVTGFDLSRSRRGAKWEQILRDSNETHLHDDLVTFAQSVWNALGLNKNHPDPFGIMGQPV
jgi:hypothetical protein